MSAKLRLAQLAYLLTLVSGFTLFSADSARAQAVDLGALGINWDFELPALTHANAAEATSTNNIGPGWTFQILSGNASNHGVQDPIGVNLVGPPAVTAFYCCFTPDTPDGVGVLPAPFQGRQIGFINLNDTDSMAQIISSPVGSIVAGQNYTLNVAVGARATDAQANTTYAIGLRTGAGVELGTLATTTLDPALANQNNIVDLTYTLTSAQATAAVGQDVSIFIRGLNAGNGPTPPDLAQANFDNVRLSGTFGAAAGVNEPLLTINRDTGAVTLSKTGATNFSITGYSLSSDTFGSFNSALWTNITTVYDDSGNGSVDPDNDWTILSAAGSTDDLSEAELEGGNGGTLATATPIALGTPWRRTPYEDVEASLLLLGGQELTVPVTYTGAAIVSGDLNADGAINTADWTAFKAGHAMNLSAMSIAQAYPFGDLNRDRQHNLTDFSLFRSAYDAANGEGSFAAMAAGVPEPGSAMLLVVGAALSAACVRRGAARRKTFRISSARLSGLASAMLALTAVALTATSASAQSVIAHWSFDATTITTDANGILTAADESGNHNATRTNAAAGVLPINSVAGQFGQAAQFTNVLGDDPMGASRLEIPNLTEFMGPAAGDFSVTAWANVAVGHTNQPNTILSDWSTTHTYWFLSQNVDSGAAARPRGQIRDTDGTDIIANTPTGAETLAAVGEDNFADGLWHHYAWTYEKAPGIMTHYIDGVVVDTVTTGNTDHDVRTSGNLVAHIGWKQDSDDHFADTMDEVWVVNGLLSGQQVINLRDTNTIEGVRLTLLIDTVDGQMQIRNDEDEPLTISGYEILSTAGGLDASGWSRISSQSLPGFPVGDGSGNGWEAGPSSSDVELTEWYLTGHSTLAPGAAVGLGSAYDEVQDAIDVVFKYTTETGGIVNGAVEFGEVMPGFNLADFNHDTFVNATDLGIWRTNFGSTTATNATGDANADGRTDGTDFLIWQRNLGATTAVAAAGAVPEPASVIMLLAACLALVGVRLRRPALAWAPIRRAVAVAAAACFAWASSAQAAVTLDREYRLGDDPQEHASAGIVVGSGVGNVNPTTTLDSRGNDTTNFTDFQDIQAGGDPLYVNVGPTGLARPGAAANSLGVAFDGADSQLNGLRLGYPGTTRSSTTPFPVVTPAGVNNYQGLSNRGFQLWVRPDALGMGTAQSVVADTNQHAARISAANNWVLRYNNANVESTQAVAFNAWSHVMVARPFGSTGSNGGGIMYVNGKAVAAQAGNYNTNSNDPLVLGANTGGTIGGDFFNGVLDQLEMFVLGKTVDNVDRGTFNFRTDNGYAAQSVALGGLTALLADVNQDGAHTQADVDDFIDGWKSENLVNGVRVGDITTIRDGDLNFDGITDLRDATILRDAFGVAAVPGIDLSSVPVPEPSTWALAAAALAGMALRMRRRHGRIASF